MNIKSRTILYIGGFQLPDKNAAALRVMANAKLFRECGHKVIFVNALKDVNEKRPYWTEYEGFDCFEYKREKQTEYLLNINRVISIIEEQNINVVVAYNYPSIALNKLRKYCQKRKIQCIADVTEWYMPVGNIVFQFIKGVDTELRMKYIHPKMDGIIAISQYLFNYYKDKVKTIKLPPLVDLSEEKWNVAINKRYSELKLIYAGSPSSQKERLDLIVDTIESSNIQNNIHLDVVGITKEQYNIMYSCKYVGNRVSFWGRISNERVIKMIKEADWTIVLREQNKVVQAGFPTKIVESIACGTPVIANKFSNITDYLNKTNSLLINEVEEFSEEIVKQAFSLKKNVKRDIFDYKLFITFFKDERLIM